eukprot:TRINITY_DN4372_c0_g1_i1.p1 TRINITY_DN4372_c0_g1~~TRINITY_DN4372_c0_g1_i1.p1  ORF type:complete len:268 (+),score=92.15 TRINITY_DN4372_c0_g1_i1:60-806(+)
MEEEEDEEYREDKKLRDDDEDSLDDFIVYDNDGGRKGRRIVKAKRTLGETEGKRRSARTKKMQSYIDEEEEEEEEEEWATSRAKRGSRGGRGGRRGGVVEEEKEEVPEEKPNVVSRFVPNKIEEYSRYEHVLAYWYEDDLADGNWFTARIVKKNETKEGEVPSYVVRFDDGDVFKNCLADKIKKITKVKYRNPFNPLVGQRVKIGVRKIRKGTAMRYQASLTKYLLFFDDGTQEWLQYSEKTWKFKED